MDHVAKIVTCTNKVPVPSCTFLMKSVWHKNGMQWSPRRDINYFAIRNGSCQRHRDCINHKMCTWFWFVWVIIAVLSTFIWIMCLFYGMFQIPDQFALITRHHVKLHPMSTTIRLMIVWLINSCSSDVVVRYCIREVELLSNTLRPRQNGRHFPGDIFKYNLF